MTELTQRQKNLVWNLRLEMLRTGYQPLYAVDEETLVAVELTIENHKESLGLPPVLFCGMNGLWFKNCELVLEVKEKTNA